MRRLKAVFISVLITSSSYAWEKPDWQKLPLEQKIAIFLSYGKPLEHDLVLYNWSRNQHAQALVSNGKISDEMYSAYMGRQYNEWSMIAGAGIYASSNANYGVGEAIVELHVPKGTVMLDSQGIYAATQEIERKYLNAHDVWSESHVFPFLYLYDTDLGWWTLRVQKGVRVREFKGEHLSATDLLKNFETMRGGERGRDVYKRAIKERAVHFALTDKDFLKSNVVSELVDRHLYLERTRLALSQVNTKEEFIAIRDLIRVNKDLRSWILEDAIAADLLKTLEARFSFLRGLFHRCTLLLKDNELR